MRALLAAALLASLRAGLAEDFGEVDEDAVTTLRRRSGGEAASAPGYDELYQEASAVQDFMVSTRRELHRHPELMYQEVFTSEKIQEKLTALGVSFETGYAYNIRQDRGIQGDGGTGIVAEIGTGHPPCVALRADMDALPIRELTEVPFRSEVDGKGHLCGHDSHVSMLLGAAAILKHHEAAINGTVRLIFQPAEEGGAGAKRMTEEGVLSKYPPVQHAFGFHVWPMLESGVVAGRAGTILSASDYFTAEISGVGGHAAMPHLTTDPIMAGAQIVTSLQSIVSRETSPMASAVVSVTQFHAGTAKNVIPKGATITGTMRSITDADLKRVRRRVTDIVHGVAGAHGCNVTMTFSADAYPTTRNDPALYEWVRGVAAPASKTGRVEEIEASLAGEDFSFFAQSVPSVFLAIGQGSGKAPPTNMGLHNPRFALDEGVMPTGAALHAHLALRALEKLRAEAA